MTGTPIGLHFTLRYRLEINVHQLLLLPFGFKRFHIRKETCPGQTAYADVHDTISLRDQDKIDGLQNWPYANGNLRGKWYLV